MAAEKITLWDSWLRRDSLKAIGRAFAKPSSLFIASWPPVLRRQVEITVLSGHFIVDLEARSVDLLPGQGFVVPKGVMHCTRAPERSVILMVESAAIVPTGDA